MSDPIDFLCVEDNLGDVGLLREGIEELALPLRMHHVVDGEQALQFLARGAHDPTARVAFVMLDLNLPRKSGLEVFEELARWEAEVVPPIIVFTTTARESDVRAASKMLRMRFLTKPLDFDEFLSILSRICEFAHGRRTLDEV